MYPDTMNKNNDFYPNFRLRAFFETLETEKQPGFLCPDYVGFLGITEKHFYDSLTSVLDAPNLDCRYTRIYLMHNVEKYLSSLTDLFSIE